MNLVDAQLAFQAYLEGHRMDPDNDELYEDYLRAKREVEIAWFRHQLDDHLILDA
jgi:hypothetical protein